MERNTIEDHPQGIYLLCVGSKWVKRSKMVPLWHTSCGYAQSYHLFWDQVLVFLNGTMTNPIPKSPMLLIFYYEQNLSRGTTSHTQDWIDLGFLVAIRLIMREWIMAAYITMGELKENITQLVYPWISCMLNLRNAN